MFESNLGKCTSIKPRIKRNMHKHSPCLTKSDIYTISTMLYFVVINNVVEYETCTTEIQAAHELDLKSLNAHRYSSLIINQIV